VVVPSLSLLFRERALPPKGREGREGQRLIIRIKLRISGGRKGGATLPNLSRRGYSQLRQGGAVKVCSFYLSIFNKRGNSKTIS
jgi:hypothetical protein